MAFWQPVQLLRISSTLLYGVENAEPIRERSYSSVSHILLVLGCAWPTTFLTYLGSAIEVSFLKLFPAQVVCALCDSGFDFGRFEAETVLIISILRQGLEEGKGIVGFQPLITYMPTDWYLTAAPVSRRNDWGRMKRDTAERISINSRNFRCSQG